MPSKDTHLAEPGLEPRAVGIEGVSEGELWGTGAEPASWTSAYVVSRVTLFSGSTQRCVLKGMTEVDARELGGLCYIENHRFSGCPAWLVGSRWGFLSRGVKYDFCFRKQILQAACTVSPEARKQVREQLS